MSVTQDPVEPNGTATTSRGSAPKDTPSRASTEVTTLPQKTSLESASTATNNSADPTAEFDGDLDTDNTIPSLELLRKVANYPVLDKDGKSTPFKSLYSGPMVARRVLVIFVRHFFCGNCQEYLRTLAQNITPDALLQLPVPTFIAVIGCGSPSLIPMYQEATSCPFPIYADPTKQLYTELGMARTIAMGPRPEYMRRSMIYSMTKGLIQGLKQIKVGLAGKAGGIHQVGGEFLFEPIGGALTSPTVTPIGDDGEEKQITWCHRMRNTRDHAEIPELREVIGVDGVGISGGNKKRWSKALATRKGTGLSSTSSKTSFSANRIDSEKLMAGTALKENVPLTIIET